MEREILPIGVSTYEAFCTCVETDVKVIYIWNDLYEIKRREVRKMLQKYGYALSGIPAKNGLLFAKKEIDLYRTGIIGSEWIF